ncbi:MAG: hypothetical protein HY825_15495 [Acidobacteria bacterium]|nr:hypothetical protein [Acidobacteriota bacterium]
MSRRRKGGSQQRDNDVDSALAALDADELREAAREMFLGLDQRAHDRAVDSLIGRAARNGSGWKPAAPTDDEVVEVLAFAKAAERIGEADPSVVDEHLRRGSAAFLRQDYDAAHCIFGALLRPIGEGEIFLGQDEMVDEVLGADAGGCAAQYVVSAYMIASPAKRAEGVRAAIEEVRSLGHFWEPIRELERVAVGPLPGLDDFLPQWRALVAREVGGERRSDPDCDEDRWLREVVHRLEGADGLAKIARSTRRADDLRAWCRGLVETGDWNAALAAFDEAAGTVADREYVRGELLDGAALAAQELGRNDLPARLERAWRVAPSMLRLRRWLASTGDKTAVQTRAAEALEACPKQAHRQRAFLHLLLGEFEPAAKLLAAAPGLGWSDHGHPGHLLFSLFGDLLAGETAPTSARRALTAHREMDIEELELMTAAEDEPRLAAPGIDQFLKEAGVDRIPGDAARRAVIAAMRKAAEHRLAGVTEKKRRRHYAHAAEIVAVCVACDRSSEAARWVASIRTEYRRFPALRAELDRAVGSPCKG